MPCDQSSTVSASGQRVRRSRSARSSRSACGTSMVNGVIVVGRHGVSPPGAPAAARLRISSTTPGSASVVVSPSSRPSATSRSRRRMILPERVLGRSSVKMIVLGRPIVPILLATCSRSSLAELVGRLGVALHGDEGDDRLAGGVVLGADHGGLGHLGVVDQGRLDLGGGDAVAGHVHDVVDPARAPTGSRRRRAWRRRRRSSGPRTRLQYVSW